MNEHEYFEVWWSKQELGNKEHYEKNRAWRMVAWSGWLERSLLAAPAPAPKSAAPQVSSTKPTGIQSAPAAAAPNDLDALLDAVRYSDFPADADAAMAQIKVAFVQLQDD